MSSEQVKTPERRVHNNVALDVVYDERSGATICFTERTGGFSDPPYTGLNMSLSYGEAAQTLLNRKAVFAMLGASDLLDEVVVPKQVHSACVSVIDAPHTMPSELVDGCDAVVCTVPDRAVMLLFADCVPVALSVPGGFAAIHSGWRGTLAGISGMAARVLCEVTGAHPHQVHAWVGPHIGVGAYEVSAELCDTFRSRFGARAIQGERNLNLSACVAASLLEAGVEPEFVSDDLPCTATHTDRFFSHRAEKGVTGRHALIAFMRQDTGGER